jgi:hypothetical protein
MTPPLAETVIPGGGLVVGLDTGVPHPPLRPGVLIVPFRTPVTLTVGFEPGVPPE